MRDWRPEARGQGRKFRYAESRAFSLPVGLGIGTVAGGCALHGAMHGVSHHTGQAGAALVEEVERDSVLVTLRVPPLVAGQEAVLSASVRDTRSGRSISEAAVSVAIRPIQGSSGGHGAPSATGDRMDAAFEDGEYRVRYTFAAPGVWEVRAMVETPGDENPIVVTATPQVGERATGHHPSVTALAVLAAAGMAVMMLVEWLVF